MKYSQLVGRSMLSGSRSMNKSRTSERLRDMFVARLGRILWLEHRMWTVR